MKDLSNYKAELTSRKRAAKSLYFTLMDITLDVLDGKAGTPTEEQVEAYEARFDECMEAYIRIDKELKELSSDSSG